MIVTTESEGNFAMGKTAEWRFPEPNYFPRGSALVGGATTGKIDNPRGQMRKIFQEEAMTSF